MDRGTTLRLGLLVGLACAIVACVLGLWSLGILSNAVRYNPYGLSNDPHIASVLGMPADASGPSVALMHIMAYRADKPLPLTGWESKPTLHPNRWVYVLKYGQEAVPLTLTRQGEGLIVESGESALDVRKGNLIVIEMDGEIPTLLQIGEFEIGAEHGVDHRRVRLLYKAAGFKVD